MIQEQETFNEYGYYSSTLSHGSNKSVLAACDDCGKVRVTSKAAYRSLCSSCVKKGKKLREAHKANLSANHPDVKGEKNPMFNKHQTDETKALMSTAKIGENHPNFGKRDAKSSNFKGGKKVANARRDAKRHRNLGFILLNTPFEDSEGHHITHNFVIYIPSALHKSVWHNLNTGQGMEEINALVLDFLVNGF